MENQSYQNIVFPMLRKLRKDHNLRQTEVVSALGNWNVALTESALSKIETGKRKVYDNELFGFTKVYKCSFEDLFSMIP